MEKHIKRSDLKKKSTGALHPRFYSKGTRRHSASIIYLNPNTNIGREVYIKKTSNGWVFDFGQASSTYHYHSTMDGALKEMKEWASHRKVKYSPGRI
jgi:hypothetical protein